MNQHMMKGYFMKKTILYICLLICLCACQNKSDNVTESALENKDINYKITKLAKLEFDGGFMPELTNCDTERVYGMMLNGSEFSLEANTNNLFVLENDKLKSFPLVDAPCVADHIMIKDQLYYMTSTEADNERSFALYKYKDGNYDEFIYRFYDETNAQLKRFGSTFLIITQNQERIDVKRYSDDGIIQMAVIKTDGELSGVTDIDIYKTSLFLTVKNDQGSAVYEIDAETGDIINQLKDQPFDNFVISDDYIAVYNGNKEIIYNRSFQPQRTYQLPKAITTADYFDDNDGIGVLTDSDNNIMIRTYQNDNCYQITSDKEAVLKDLTVRFIGKTSLIATTAENDIYKIEFEIND